MAGVHSMVDFVRRAIFGRQPAEDVPEDIARALDASAEDLKHGRIVSLDDTLSEMEAELETHLARKKAQFR